MTLTTRLSLFFLAALALVLAGFSATLYLLADNYLYRQAGERLESNVNMLIAAAEVGPDGVEWEPGERSLALDEVWNNGPVRWAVTDGEGRWLDGSRQVVDGRWIADPPPLPTVHQETPQDLLWQGQHWRVLERRLEADSTKKPTEPPSQEGQGHKYPLVVLTVGVSLQPLQGTLRNLGMALAGVSAGIWLLACIMGRWFCRRALSPVRRMATAARGMDAAHLCERLPGADTGDELADLSNAFNDLLDRLQESFERQRRFTGDASHQLRTPLTAMLGQTDVALRRERSPEEYQRAFASVRDQVLHLREMVEMLLFLARTESEAKLPDRETIDLADWMSAHLEARADHPWAEDVHLACAADGPLYVEVQTPLLSQLVDNLLDNACKYSAPGTPVIVRLRREEGAVVLAVEDAGCGIAEQELTRIFEPFYRAPDARRAGTAGVGLGLAIANRIAIAFGGTMSVDSEPGRGSRFTLRLPAAAAGASAASSRENPRLQHQDVESSYKR
jgi:heavy metal sensor kinase